MHYGQKSFITLVLGLIKIEIAFTKILDYDGICKPKLSYCLISESISLGVWIYTLKQFFSIIRIT